MRPTVLATDLDHTLIPLPDSEQNVQDLARLDESLRQADVTLVYVTGRHFASAVAAIDEFQLPSPDWIISNVGTAIHQNGPSGFESLLEYEQHLRELMPAELLERQKAILAEMKSLTLQEKEKQSRFKLSYYVPQRELESTVAALRREMIGDSQPLSIVASTDPVDGVGLLDLLPANVTKAYALHWWAVKRGLNERSIVFAGDSGNDLAALCSGYLALVVGNANVSVRKAVEDHHVRVGWKDRLFLSTQDATSGVLDGCRHFKLLR